MTQTWTPPATTPSPELELEFRVYLYESLSPSPLGWHGAARMVAFIMMLRVRVRVFHGRLHGRAVRNRAISGGKLAGQAAVLDSEALTRRRDSEACGALRIIMMLLRVEVSRPGELRVEASRPGELRVEGSRPGELRVEGSRPGELRVEGSRPGELPADSTRSEGPGRVRL